MIPRSETRQANAVLKAINAALADGPLPKEWFEAFAMDDAEAAAAHERAAVMHRTDPKRRARR